MVFAFARRLPMALRRRLGRFRRRLRRYPVVYNVFGAAEAGGPKRALLLYLTEPFVLPPNDPKWAAHQNRRQCRQIAELLGDLGYVVDAGHARDRRFASPHAYDLVLCDRGDPDANFRTAPGAQIVFIGTTMEHALHNRNLLQRHEMLSRRRPGAKVDARRVYSEHLPLLDQADAIVSFGNEWSANTWRARFRGPIYPFNNYAFRETAQASDQKDFTAARRHFLFFASGSQMQKGLDLLLEVFPRHPDLHLYVCSGFATGPDFCRVYRRELFETPNVHPVGWVTVNSPQFRDLMARCGCLVYPTCSEGQAGSVVQCMYAGVIPMVTRDAGIDTEGFAVPLESNNLDALERAITEVAARPAEWHRRQSLRAQQVALEKYSEDAFLSRWRQILTDITSGAQGRAA